MIPTAALPSRPTRLLLLLGVVSVAIGLDGCATVQRRSLPSARDSATARTQLEIVTDGYWRFLQQSRPELAAQAGLIVPALPDPTLDRAKKDAQIARAALLSLDDIDVEALSEDDYISWLTMRWDNEMLGGWVAFHWTHLTDLAPGRSVLDRSAEILGSQAIRVAADGERMVGLVRAMAALTRTTRFEFEQRSERGIRTSRAFRRRAAAHVRSFIAPAEFSPFGMPATFTPTPDSAWQVQLVQDVAETIRTQVNPALDTLATVLELEDDRAPAEIGLSGYPGGAQHYAQLLRFHSTLEVSPTDAHALGLREVARLASRVAALRREARLPADRDSLRAALARDSALAVRDPRVLPELTVRWMEFLAPYLDSLFQPAPTGRLAIGLIPADVEAASPLATYDAATVGHDARYRLNGAALASRSAIILPGFVVADLLPGLHRQQSVQRENETLPVFRRLAFHGGFVNGWRTYALAVADSVSGGLSPALRFGVRLRELAVACGLVVDTGINALGWSRADALRFLRSYLPDDDAELDREFIFEAFEAPGTLAASALGARELHGLRRWVERELGERFDLAAFHRELLRTGSVPLPVLGSHLERWIWEQRTVTAPPP